MANKITKFASLGGSNIPYSQGAKKKKVSHMIATTLNFGIGSFFLTFSPQGSKSPFSFQLSHIVRDPKKFPVNFCHKDNANDRTHDEMLNIMRGGQGDYIFFSGGQEFDLSEKKMIELYEKNPVASTIAFQKINSLMFELIFGISQARDIKRTIPFTPRTLDINGHPKYPMGAISNIDGTIEEQKRRDLHAHYIVTGGPIDINMVEKNINSPETRSRLSRLYESIIISSMPLPTMLLDMVDERVKVKTSPLQTGILYPNSGINFIRQATERATSLQVHVHQNKPGGTCTATNIGKTQCRLSQPQALSGSTKFYQLKSDNQNNQGYTSSRIRSGTNLTSTYNSCERNWEEDPVGNSHSITPSTSSSLIVLQPKREQFQLMIDPQNLSDILIKKKDASHRIPLSTLHSELRDNETCSINSHTPTEFEDAVDTLRTLFDESKETDVRHSSGIYERLQLDELLQQRINNMTTKAKDLLLLACEKRNGYFVEFIPELTQLLGCNIAPYFLGNPEQAKSIIYYIIKYVTKDKASVAASLTLLKKSCENVLTYPSVAPNSGTDVRNATHLVTKFINSNMGGLIEVSEQQAVMHLLNFSESVNTHTTINMFVTGLVSSVIAFAGNQIGISEDDSWQPDIHFPSTVIIDLNTNTPASQTNYENDTLFNEEPVELYNNSVRGRPSTRSLQREQSTRTNRTNIEENQIPEENVNNIQESRNPNNDSEERNDILEADEDNINLVPVNRRGIIEEEEIIESILHTADLPHVFNRVTLYRDETNSINAVPQDEFYRKRCQWDNYRYKFINTFEYPHPGHKVIVEIGHETQYPLAEWQINYYKYIDEGIASMSFREWVMCMKIEKRPEGAQVIRNNIPQANDPNSRNAPGRKPNGRYPLNESSVLFISHENVQKSIIHIPIYASGTIPKYPGRKLNNGERLTELAKKKQDEWALYILCVFDRCNIDGIPTSLVSNVQLGERRGQETHLITGRPVYEINQYVFKRPWIALQTFLKELEKPSIHDPTTVPFINRSIIQQIKNISFSMKAVSKTRRERVTKFRNRNTDKWAEGSKLPSQYGKGWGISGGWPEELQNPNYLNSIPGYQQNGNEEDDDADGITEAQRDEAAQIIADIQSMTDDQVYSLT